MRVFVRENGCKPVYVRIRIAKLLLSRKYNSILCESAYENRVYIATHKI